MQVDGLADPGIFVQAGQQAGALLDFFSVNDFHVFYPDRFFAAGLRIHSGRSLSCEAGQVHGRETVDVDRARPGWSSGPAASAGGCRKSSPAAPARRPGRAIMKPPFLKSCMLPVPAARPLGKNQERVALFFDLLDRLGQRFLAALRVWSGRRTRNRPASGSSRPGGSSGLRS